MEIEQKKVNGNEKSCFSRLKINLRSSVFKVLSFPTRLPKSCPTKTLKTRLPTLFTHHVGHLQFIEDIPSLISLSFFKFIIFLIKYRGMQPKSLQVLEGHANSLFPYFHSSKRMAPGNVQFGDVTEFFGVIF